MSNITKFLLDFVSFFLIIMSTLVVSVFEIITQCSYLLQKIWYDVVVPACVELLADAYFIMLIAWQGILSFASDAALFLSKLLLVVSKNAHEMSERLIHKAWLN
jgi:hypothetical protein